MDLLIGLDVGTTATKAMLCDRLGNVRGSSSRAYGLITPQAGWVEQDPEELWRAVVETLGELAGLVTPADRVLALAQSSQAGTTIPVDEHGMPTYNALSWMDHRAVEQAQQVRQQWGPDFVYGTTGWPLQSGLPLQHIVWLKHNRPEVFSRTARFLFVNDFISWRLTGQLCMNPSDASITQLMNIATGDWDDRLLATAGIARHQLSPVRPSGQVVGELTGRASDATGLPTSLIVVNGAHDQYCAAVSTGVFDVGAVLLSCGTAWVLLAVPPDLETGLDSGMAISLHAVPGRYGAIHSLGGVGTSLEWFLDNIWTPSDRRVDRAELYRAVNEAVERSPVGAKKLLFYPLAGGHAAIGTAGGGFLGLTLAHSRDDMARAVMEGIVLQLRWAVQEMQGNGIQVNEFKMVGGAAESAVWPQIVADVTGIPVTLPVHKQAASRGAAILAGVGGSMFASMREGCEAFQGALHKRVPFSEHKRTYDDAFQIYQGMAK
jgi:xylulokinase